MMAGKFDGLAVGWSARCLTQAFFLPVGEALGHPRLCDGEAVGSGCCGLGVWGAAHHGPAHTGPLVGEAAARGLHTVCSCYGPRSTHRQHPNTITTTTFSEVVPRLHIFHIAFSKLVKLAKLREYSKLRGLKNWEMILGVYPVQW